MAKPKVQSMPEEDFPEEVKYASAWLSFITRMLPLLGRIALLFQKR